MTETPSTVDAADPFAGGASEDPFDQPNAGGNFPKLEDLEDMLLLIRPTVIKQVPDRFAPADAPRLKDRATCDVTVFQADGTHKTHRGMYISQAGILPQLQEILDAKNPNKPFVLGVLAMLPNKAAKAAGIDTKDKLKAALAAWVKRGGKGDKPGYFWGLEKFTADQAALARPVALGMINQNNPFA